MLQTDEKISAQKDFINLIKQTGETGRLIRPMKSGTGSFNGPAESSEEIIKESFSLEWHQLSPENLKQIGGDGVIHVLPDLDIRDGDMVEHQQERYRVTDVRDESLYGVNTQKVVRLEREYRG